MENLQIIAIILGGILAFALHLSTFALFRPGNRPLSIPWEDMTAQPRPFGVELRFYRAEGVPLTISRQLAGRLEQAAAGGSNLKRDKRFYRVIVVESVQSAK